MSSNSGYSSDLPMYLGQTPDSESTTYPAVNATSFAPWTTTDYHHPALSSTPTSEFGSVWPYTSTSHDDPTMFSSPSSGLDWHHSYEPLPTTTGGWAPSVNPSTASAYSAATVPIPSSGFSSATSVWSSSDYQASLSPYSDGRPPLTRSISADNGASSDFLPSIPRAPGSSAPTSPMGYQALETASLSSTSPFAAMPSRPKDRTGSRSASKRPESKLRPTAGGIVRRKSPGPATLSSSASSSGGSSSTVAASAVSAEKQYQNQLEARFGPAMSAMAPGKEARLTSEQIRREAWRICKAEALEMSQRRMKLLEHEHGALERETQQLQVNIGLMREAVVREQAELEDALGRAERLSSSG